MKVPKRDSNEPPFDIAELEGLHNQSSVYKDAGRLGGILSASERLQKEQDRVMGIVQAEMKAMEDARKMYEIPGLDAVREYERMLNTPAMEAIRRANELNDIIKGPAGISSIVAEMTARPDLTGMFDKQIDIGFSEPPYANMRPPEIPRMYVSPPNPIHETNSLLEENTKTQEKIATSLKKLVESAEDTTKQNVKMIRISTASLIIGVVSVVVGVVGAWIGYQAGMNSSAPVTKAAPVSIRK